MHRLSTMPGGWTPEAEGVIFVEQTQAPLVFLTAADTDVQLLATVLARLPHEFPALRVANLLQLQQHLSIDTYAEDVLCHAQGIVLRILGGRSYWSYGLEVVKQTVQQTGATLFVLPGDDRPDPELTSHSTAPLVAVDRLWRYFIEGGVDNTLHALQFLADTCLGSTYNPPMPVSIPRVGLYEWNRKQGSGKAGEKLQLPITDDPLPPVHSLSHAKAGILFYRAHYLAGNTAPIDALCQALADRQLEPVPVFVSSLRDPEVPPEVLTYFQSQENSSQENQPQDVQHGAQHGAQQDAQQDAQHDRSIQVLLNTTSFSLAKLDAETPQLGLWQQLDVPVLQVILSSGTQEQWQTQTRGLSPRDIAMNVALPEVDGRIISRAISFKTVQSRSSLLETDVVGYEAVDDRLQFVADLAANWVHLRQTSPANRRIALILANYPTRDGRLANGVGLDTPASCIEILKALQQQGYQVNNIPATGDELIQRLTAAVTNDLEGQLRPVSQFLPLEDYLQYFTTLPAPVQQAMADRWGKPEAWASGGAREDQCSSSPSPIPISGIQLGNIFVGIQPARGYDLDPSLNYHAPDLEPTHAYLGFYYWLRQYFGANAIVHIGKHGNLEWLPGKGVALSEACYPEVALGALPHLYPFIVNDPGEGSQAKRRSQAVIIDHLTPPMTRAELYGALQQLEGLIDEYYEAQSLDPTRLPVIRDRILALVTQENLHQDLGEGNRQQATDNHDSQILRGEADFAQPTQTLPLASPDTWVDFLSRMDGYLCELKEAQIRDGLHIFGQCPQGRQLRDLLVSIARHPGQGRLGLTRAIAQDWGLGFDPLTANPAEAIRTCGSGLGDQVSGIGLQELGTRDWKFGSENSELNPQDFNKTQTIHHNWRTVGDAIESLEEHAAALVETLLAPSPACLSTSSGIQRELDWIRDRLLPNLLKTNQEITYLLHGLEGGYVPSGASGAPTRGRPEVLPTGRNFYSVDIRAIPTESAWDVGRKAAETLIEQYTQENGEYPKTLALSIWGTSTMRTGGDDLAEALALLGVRPIWDGASRRVVDFEILPLSALGRPRVDVTLRISGFFRDAFPNLIDLFHQAVEAVAALDEPAEQNPLAAQVRQDSQTWQIAGLSPEQAMLRAQYRVFGSKPGAYGAGLQGLIEAQNWIDDQDLARAYINWSSYAYTGQGEGTSASDAFEQRLQQLQIVLHNQDNREHDLLDSDDYYQFQGGLTAAVRALTGKNPQTYFGDHSLPENPKVHQLRAEIARVYRSRIVNPKWIAGVMRHGYKGAFEMAATVDYLFAYDATARCVEDYMYQGVAEAYLFDPTVQEFIQQRNPWALRDMAERMLEAHQRELWQNVDESVLEKLRTIAHQAEAVIEHQGWDKQNRS